jgi:hypothetical protein
MSDTNTAPCGCCVGATRETPAPITNRPGLSRIAYRAGTHASFKASLLSTLSDPAFPALAPLTTRDDSDFSIALLDAFAVSADILTFYQERLANEAYLRTAVQQRSVFELARLVGYQPSPGVAASAPLAFTLNDAPGAPDSVTIDPGTRVQSVPTPGQQPAVFETAAPLVARIAQNALPAITTNPVAWTEITTSLWLAGTATGLKSGDAILFVDIKRLGTAGPNSQLWELRVVTAVTPDPPGGRTLIVWDEPLFDTFRNGATIVQLYALRKRASLFGVNAPDPHLLPPNPPGGRPLVPNRGANDWIFVHDPEHVDLDTVYPDIVPGAAGADFATAPERFSWLVLSRGRQPRAGHPPRPFRRLYRITAAADRAPLRYTLSGKATGLNLDTDERLAGFVAVTRETTAFIQSEPLTIAEQPIVVAQIDGHALGPGMLKPVYGTAETVLGGGTLAAGQNIAVIGKRVRLQLGDDPHAALVGPDGRTPIAVAKGDVFLVDAYPPSAAASGAVAWSVLTTKGEVATLTAAASAVVLLPADDKADAEVTEAAVLAGAKPGAARTVLTFTSALARIYDRRTVRINANVVDATHGETVKEILGGADSSVANQTFALKQSPLTYISVPQGQGAQSTLQVWVNDLRWQEQPTLLNAGPRDRVFVTRHKDDGGVIVQFGDGRRGARPPTGQTNVRAVYRKGLGTSGDVAAGQISQAIDRPAGLRSVINPAAATGGADPDTPAAARQSASLHVRTLERVVSLQDYEDFSLAFAGIARALATWTWFGRTRGVVVTVAGPRGTLLDANGDTIGNLIKALRSAGNPYVPVAVLPHRTVFFQVAGLVRVDTQNYDPDYVMAAARRALAAAFGFDTRMLGQGVTQSEAVAAIQAVAGVVAVRLTLLTREDSATILPDFLTAGAPESGARAIVSGAELLLIDPLSVSLLERWQ